MSECVFCGKDKITTDIVYEDDLVMAFMDAEPINEGHILIVPRAHYLDIDEIPDELLAHLLTISKRIVSALKEIYRPNGYSIIHNGGEFNDTGHFHLHIFPRYMGDGFGWTCGDSRPVSMEAAKRIKDRLRF